MRRRTAPLRLALFDDTLLMPAQIVVPLCLEVRAQKILGQRGKRGRQASDRK